jgi:hypothetical protein
MRRRWAEPQRGQKTAPHDAMHAGAIEEKLHLGPREQGREGEMMISGARPDLNFWKFDLKLAKFVLLQRLCSVV